MPANIIHMDVDIARDTARLMGDSWTKMTDALESANRAVDNLVPNNFRGLSADEFQTAYLDLKSKLNQYITTLNDLKSTLDREIEQFIEMSAHLEGRSAGR